MGPIRGQTRPLPIQADIISSHKSNVITLNASIHNRFDVEVIDASSGQIKQRAQAENVILNRFWGQINNGFGNYIAVGSGSGTPAITDTGLFTFLDVFTANSVSSYGIDDPFVYYMQKKCVLSETVLVGSTITEIGIASSTSNGYVNTHAMLQDMNGNAISIKKTNTDIINVYATTYCHWKNDSDAKILMCNATSDKDNNSLPARVVNGGLIGTYVIQLGCCDGYGAYSYESTLTLNASAFDAATKTLNFTLTRLGASYANGLTNARGLRVVCYDNGGLGSDSLSSAIWIPASAFNCESDIVGEAIGTGNGTTQDYKTAFSIISGATVYVNGTAATVTVDEGVPFVGSNVNVLFDSYVLLNGKLMPYGCSIVGATNYKNHDSGFYSDIVFENRFSNKIGITKIKYGNATLSVSNDLTTWTSIASEATIPSNLIYAKYFRFTFLSKTTLSNVAITTTRSSDNNIHFATPPASGSVITANYHTACIAKDSNHVFDASISVQFGPHTA
jgi:hypothetical protein